MAGEVGQVADVVRQEGGRVVVSLPMIGFPPGFELTPGDRVLLVQGDDGPAVRPLVRALTVQERPVESDGELEADGQRFATQAAAVRDEGDGPPYRVWVVDRADGEQGQVIAINPQRR